ncbi:hypothetical protein [Massilia psychrophila]|jgi:hypothetical protein|nr:hypothetical protein [Massilia psychrophila]
MTTTKQPELFATANNVYNIVSQEALAVLQVLYQLYCPQDRQTCRDD